jgi:hypothetical protein
VCTVIAVSSERQLPQILRGARTIPHALHVVVDAQLLAVEQRLLEAAGPALVPREVRGRPTAPADERDAHVEGDAIGGAEPTLGLVLVQLELLLVLRVVATLGRQGGAHGGGSPHRDAAGSVVGCRRGVRVEPPLMATGCRLTRESGAVDVRWDCRLREHRHRRRRRPEVLC